MSGATWLRVGSILGALAVGVGAFGAHGLRGGFGREVDAGTRTAADVARALEVFETGARYHLVHALAIVAVGLVVARPGGGGAAATAAGWAFLLGIVLFSGSLYGIVLAGEPGLGRVTPVGGLLLIAGWLALAWAASPPR